MKQTIITLTILLLTILPNINAQQHKHCRRMTRQQFRQAQKNYITQQAGLTTQEAAQFLPLYFKNRDHIAKIKQQLRQKINHSQDYELTPQGYLKLIHEIDHTKHTIDSLETASHKQYQKILPPQKLFLVIKSEMNFSRRMLKRKCATNH